MQVHLKRSDPTVDAIIRAAFPSFNGQNITATPADTVRFSGTEWSEGSKSDYRIVRLEGLHAMAIQQAPFFERSPLHETDFPIPPGYVVVEWHRWGQRESIDIRTPAANISPMLPAPVEVTADERTVLLATKGLKSTYGGEKNFRFHEANRRTGITLDRYESAKQSCIAKRWLNRAGAITTDGRNVVGADRL